MRLADFIVRDMHAILAQWEAFAGTRFPAATSMTPGQLRDHAQQILEAVVKDWRVPRPWRLHRPSRWAELPN